MDCKCGWVGAVSADNWLITAGVESKLNYEHASFFPCLQHCFPLLNREHGYRKLSVCGTENVNPYGFKQICA